MNFISEEGKKKLYIVGVIVVVSLTMYLAIKYLLPVIWPFLLAFFIAHLLDKCVNFLSEKLKLNSKVALALVVFLIMAAVVIIFGMIFYNIAGQIREFVINIDMYTNIFSEHLKSLCDTIETTFGVESSGFYEQISVKVYGFINGIGERIVVAFMGNGTAIAKETINFIILLVITFTAIIYMTKDMENIRKYLDNSFFGKEIGKAKSMIKTVFGAYLKAQFIIVCIVSVICSAGLLLIGNPYSILIGVLLGVTDALPLLGVGTILLPWTVISLIIGNYTEAAVLFTMFVISYMAREFLEPKIMGKSIGIHPVVSLLAVYTGYELFGFFGMIIGPFVFLVILEITKKCVETLR